MPHARTTDPTTSHEAAASVKHLSRTQSGILGILRTPRTDQELVDWYQYMAKKEPTLFPQSSESGIRSRRAELVKLGLVCPVGYAKTKANRNTIVWSAA